VPFLRDNRNSQNDDECNKLVHALIVKTRCTPAQHAGHAAKAAGVMERHSQKADAAPLTLSHK